MFIRTLLAMVCAASLAACSTTDKCGGDGGPGDCGCSALELGTQPARDGGVEELGGPADDGGAVELISLPVKRRAQQQADDCGPTNIWMLARFWGSDVTHADVMSKFNILAGIGVYDSHMAMAAMDLGYKAKVISYNYRVLHPLWHALSQTELLAQLKNYLPKIKNDKDRVSAQGYIDYLERGGAISFEPLSRELLLAYLRRGVPLSVSLDVEYLYRGGTTTDPYRPQHWTHAVVVHGYDASEDAFEVADPWPHIPLTHTDGHYFVSAARLITAILVASQINDAFVVVVDKS